MSFLAMLPGLLASAAPKILSTIGEIGKNVASDVMSNKIHSLGDFGSSVARGLGIGNTTDRKLLPHNRLKHRADMMRNYQGTRRNAAETLQVVSNPHMAVPEHYRNRSRPSPEASMRDKSIYSRNKALREIY